MFLKQCNKTASSTTPLPHLSVMALATAYIFYIHSTKYQTLFQLQT